jgi:hypothetical protein
MGVYGQEILIRSPDPSKPAAQRLSVVVTLRWQEGDFDLSDAYVAIDAPNVQGQEVRLSDILAAMHIERTAGLPTEIQLLLELGLVPLQDKGALEVKLKIGGRTRVLDRLAVRRVVELPMRQPHLS